MRSLKITLIGLWAILQIGLNSSYSQSPVGIGQWRVHYNFSHLENIALTEDKIYCANDISLFYYDKIDKSLNPISKKEGLTGVNISKLASYKNEEILVGYSDGTIDFIDGSSITPFNDIQRANITGSKNINHFQERDNKILISTDYGLSILDMSKREISDSYINISADGTANIFYASVLSQDGDSIFVASSKGLLGAKYSSAVNLRDYTNWKLYGTSDGLPTGAVKSVGRSGDVIFAGVNTKGIYYFDGTQWQATGISGNNIKSISIGEDAMVATVDVNIYKFTSPTNSQLYYRDYIYGPQAAVIGTDGVIYFSQDDNGICFYTSVLDLTMLGRPVGPLFNESFRLKYLDSKVINCRGGLSASFGNIYLESSAMVLGQDDIWNTYTIYNAFPPASRDLLDMTIQSGTKWFFSTFGWGLIQFNPTNNNYTVWDTTNSQLKMLYITGLTTDKDGTVWVCAHSQVDRTVNKPFLHAIDPSGTWSSFKAAQSDGKYPNDIVIDKQSNKWIRILASDGKRGLIMFKEINKAAGTSTQIYFGVEQNKGALPSLNVNTISVDQTGQVWLGTDQGICVFTNPAQITPTNIPKAYLPIVNGFPLFFDKRINCIKTDAANRKWVGTPDGVFLLSADGLETLLNFDKTNSPMIDNNVNTITINELSGEVFFGTEKGIISYRGDATFGAETHSNVKIFPNPVEPNFEGWVGISGLANDARVKITDIAGKLTYETPANGGTASWNLKDYTGRRATAGIYLIFSASDDGKEKFVGKIAVLD